jgi:hypothetical protein
MSQQHTTKLNLGITVGLRRLFTHAEAHAWLFIVDVIMLCCLETVIFHVRSIFHI